MPRWQARKPEGRRVHRVQIDFSDGAHRALTTLAERSGRTLAEVLRDAIGLEKFFLDERSKGNRILVEQRDGTFREVINP